MFHVEQNNMEVLRNCKICGSTEFTTYLECSDFFFTKEKFILVSCNTCGFVFINPRPETEKLQYYYHSDEYISHSGNKKGLVNSIYLKIRNYTHHKKLHLVEKRSNGKNILDIGCGSGELLKLFKDNKWEVLGVEPNTNARNFAITSLRIKVIDEPELSSIPSQSMNVITMWHVLEHVSDLNLRMSELKRIIKNDGVIIIAVPNYRSYDASYYGKYWAAYDVPRHLYHFSQDTMKKLLLKHQFEIIDIKPMKFDSYYVSMLSEKYLNGKQNIIKALLVGLKSNCKAKKNKMNYSSLIYIVKNL